MLMNFYFILQKQSFALCLFYQQIKWKKKQHSGFILLKRKVMSEVYITPCYHYKDPSILEV